MNVNSFSSGEQATGNHRICAISLKCTVKVYGVSHAILESNILYDSSRTYVQEQSMLLFARPLPTIGNGLSKLITVDRQIPNRNSRSRISAQDASPFVLPGCQLQCCCSAAASPKHDFVWQIQTPSVETVPRDQIGPSRKVDFSPAGWDA